MEFTDQQKQVLAIARRLRPECVLEADRFGGLSLWRSDGDVWKFSGPISAFSQLEEYSILFTHGLGADGNGRELADLARAMKEGRVLGMSAEATTWIDAVALAHGIPITWRAPKANTPPAELPKTLPAGTKWLAGRYYGEFIGEARLDGGYYQGRSLSVWGSGIPTDDERSIPKWWIDWSSVPASAKDECWTPKVGDRVRIKESYKFEDARRRFGTICETEVCRGHCRVELDGASPSYLRMWQLANSDVEPIIIQPANLPTDDGAKCDAGYRPVVMADPYLTHNAFLSTNPAFAAWSREQGKKRGTERRFGVMGNRDKYGQLLGATWDSDDVESV